MSEFAPVGFESAGYLDAAETFSESDLTLTHNSTGVSNGSVGLTGLSDGTTAGVPTDNDTVTGQTDKRGLVINPNKDLAGVKVDISANTTGVTTAYLTDPSTGNTLASASYSSGTATIEYDLVSGTTYHVVSDAGGNSYDRGRYGSPSYPYSSTDIDISSGATSPSNSSSLYTYNIENVTAKEPATSGSVAVEWPYPNDVYRWDAVLFQHTLDGETVTVDIQESTDGGSTWNTIATDVSRGQEITALPESEVRFIVDISRSNTANNPTLNSIHQRYVV